MHGFRSALDEVADRLGTESNPVFEILLAAVLTRRG